MALQGWLGLEKKLREKPTSCQSSLPISPSPQVHHFSCVRAHNFPLWLSSFLSSQAGSWEQERWHSRLQRLATQSRVLWASLILQEKKNLFLASPQEHKVTCKRIWPQVEGEVGCEWHVSSPDLGCVQSQPDRGGLAVAIEIWNWQSGTPPPPNTPTPPALSFSEDAQGCSSWCLILSDPSLVVGYHQPQGPASPWSRTGYRVHFSQAGAHPSSLSVDSHLGTGQLFLFKSSDHKGPHYSPFLKQ